MSRPPFARAVLLIGLVAAGCGSTDAYVFRKNEFNRNDPDFNKPVVDRDDVTICYNAVVASDGDIGELAQEECSRFGKIATAGGKSFGDCPLLTPVAASFFCVVPKSAPATTDQPSPATPETRLE